MALMFMPAACKAVMADSRPEPGPLTRTSTSFRPNFDAFSAATSAARWAANGVLLRLPLKPTVPGRRVAQRVAVGVGDGDDRVVERRLDVGDAPADVPSLLAFLALGHGLVNSPVVDSQSQ